jgi:hypothetical protein
MDHLVEVKTVSRVYDLLLKMIKDNLSNCEEEDLRALLLESINLNSKSYFIILFSILENWIDKEYRELVGNPADAYFMEKVDNIIGSRPFLKNQIEKYYFTRSDIVHGRLKKVQTIDVLGVAKNITAIIERGVE